MQGYGTESEPSRSGVRANQSLQQAAAAMLVYLQADRACKSGLTDLSNSSEAAFTRLESNPSIDEPFPEPQGLDRFDVGSPPGFSPSFAAELLAWRGKLIAAPIPTSNSSKTCLVNIRPQRPLKSLRLESFQAGATPSVYSRMQVFSRTRAVFHPRNS